MTRNLIIGKGIIGLNNWEYRVGFDAEDYDIRRVRRKPGKIFSACGRAVFRVRIKHYLFDK